MVTDLNILHLPFFLYSTVSHSAERDVAYYKQPTNEDPRGLLWVYYKDRRMLKLRHVRSPSSSTYFDLR